jgi:hypothetical protein
MQKSAHSALPILYRLSADLIFLFHFVVVMIILFGWLVPVIWPLYMFTLVVSLISDIVFGYCLLSKWEFVLRKKFNPSINYDYDFTTYYTYRLTNRTIRDNFMKIAAITFISLSILVNIVFRFLV